EQEVRREDIVEEHVQHQVQRLHMEKEIQDVVEAKKIQIDSTQLIPKTVDLSEEEVVIGDVQEEQHVQLDAVTADATGNELLDEVVLIPMIEHQ
ncbi:hypothetical protein L7F22_050721, partial [Adiantum nelumboides]|nr:hypothetical protein [Adiantum nelumboides]